MKLIVGLGNPGKEYENTKHNVGFLFLEYLEKKHNFKITTKKFNSLITEVYLNNNKIIIAKPQTYMNLSGQTVAKIREYYKIENKDIIVIFDDLDIPFGEIRYKEKGSGGTHNGMKNIVQCLNTKDFPRIKIGIGGIKPERQDLKDFVLSNFTSRQKEELETQFEKAYEKLLLFIDN